MLLELQRFNTDPLVDGILLQLPLPNGLDEGPLLTAIDPDKDADGLHTLNLGRLLKGEPGPRSCTPAGVMALLRSNGFDPAGKRAVVVGRSILVGQPMALMLQSAHATVSVAHSRTRDLAALTRQAEILVVAAGRPGMNIFSSSGQGGRGTKENLRCSSSARAEQLILCDVRRRRSTPKRARVPPLPTAHCGGGGCFNSTQ